VNLCRVTSLYE